MGRHLSSRIIWEDPEELGYRMVPQDPKELIDVLVAEDGTITEVTDDRASTFTRP